MLIAAYLWVVQLVKSYSKLSVSTFLEFVIKKQSICDQSIFHYLDDYIMAFLSRDQCRLPMEQFQNMCKEVGVPIAHETTEDPTRVITYFGLEIQYQLRLESQQTNYKKTCFHRCSPNGEGNGPEAGTIINRITVIYLQSG